MRIILDTPVLSSSEVSCLSSSELGTFCIWRCGFSVREVLPRATFYRHRKFILRFVGVDISSECPSCVSSDAEDCVEQFFEAQTFDSDAFDSEHTAKVEQ